MSNDSLISIIIPVYNTEDYLEESLNSVINQTYKNIEIICIDDASTDNSLKILNDYAKKDKRITVLSNENNLGPSYSRNKGLNVANGEFILFHDSDDVVDLDAYEKLMGFYKRYPNHDFVIFNMIRFNDYGQKYSSILHSKSMTDEIFSEINILQNPKLIYDTVTTNKIIRRQFLEEINIKFIENIVYEDIAFSMKMLTESNCFGVYPDVKYHWRVRSNNNKSITQTVYSTKNLKDRIHVTKFVLKLFNSDIKYKPLLDLLYIKLVEFDILQFINEFDLVDDEFIDIMYDEVKPFVETLPESSFSTLDGNDLLKYHMFLNEDTKGLIINIKNNRIQNKGNKEIQSKLAESENEIRLLKSEQYNQSEKIRKRKSKNKLLRKEIKNIKSTKGWFKYKINNLYLRAFKDDEFLKQMNKPKNELEDALFYENPELFARISQFRKFGMPKSYVNAVKNHKINSKMVFFESNLAKQYTGNPRYIYEKMLKSYPDYTYVWSYNGDGNNIPGNPIIVERKSEQYYKYLAQSAIVINNTTFPNWYFRDETFYLQTWHGTPYKRLHWDRNNDKYCTPHFYIKQKGWDALLSPNSYSTERFKSAFRYDGDVITYGYPANDIFYNEEEYSSKRNSIREKLGINDDELVYLYAPTWRDGTHIGNCMFKFDLLINPKKFLDNAPENSVLLIRSHHMSNSSEALKDLNGKAVDVSNWDDATELMCAADILITDYSSIVFDWYCSKKPVIYYVPDLEDYENKVRGVYFNIRETNCGVICQSEEELYDNLDIKDAPFYEDFYNKFCSIHDGHSSEKVISYILDKSKTSPIKSFKQKFKKNI